MAKSIPTEVEVTSTMLSYRDHLAKIGYAPNADVFYSGFASTPRSLRAAMRSMNAPPSNSWSEVFDINRDDYWTDEIQGVAWNGSHWIFSANANQDKPGCEDKALYVFNASGPFGDGDWASRLRYENVPHSLANTTEEDCHWGQVTYYKGKVYVSHFWSSGPGSSGPERGRANVVVFKSEGGNLEYHDWIPLSFATSPTQERREMVEFQGINPWDGRFYTCFGGDEISEFFMHDPENGDFLGETLTLARPISRVQGACFSPNGHLYVATNEPLPNPDHEPYYEYQAIWYYSALNGHCFGRIPVRAPWLMLDPNDTPPLELEGVCFANLGFADGARAQIHTIVLDNKPIALDDIYFRGFGSSHADIV